MILDIIPNVRWPNCNQGEVVVNKLLGSLIVVFLFQYSVHAADKIRIAYPSAVGHFITLPLAQNKGFLKEEGIDAEIVQIRPLAAVPALANGEIDYYAGVGPVVTAAIRGVSVRIVTTYVPTLPIMLIARPEFKSVMDLKGKAIGIGVIGSSPHIVTRLILKHFGLDPDKDVKSVPGGSADSRLAALQQGLIAAAVVPPPFDFFAKKLGFNTLARAQDLLTYPEGGLSTTIKKIAERPDEIKRVIEAGIKANRYIRTEREGTIQFLMEWQKIDREVATATYESVSNAYSEDGTVPEDGLRTVIEEAKKSAKVNHEVSISQVADLSILKQAQRELGIK
jgi:ABC-type nitrate/sulfonate/bicarbonate transport system substrate-binding protein